jgi:hypothetical protein
MTSASVSGVSEPQRMRIEFNSGAFMFFGSVGKAFRSSHDTTVTSVWETHQALWRKNSADSGKQFSSRNSGTYEQRVTGVWGGGMDSV